ncbi:hypothetical protein NQ117_12475 [Paenibacillus sp. SC116]|uniref:hypothetical protein n=1 Tax=Paenibacillus sp. SC116 TaxID=2968986 RepID=UPI00215B513D|nr:hypothetical protein [Paenibacillus sp. SC116]MCR8844500.1 hypothetical protein [Paenibacillus sp. SC116]
MKFDIEQLYWLHKPNRFTIEEDRIEMITEPYMHAALRTHPLLPSLQKWSLRIVNG